MPEGQMASPLREFLDYRPRALVNLSKGKPSSRPPAPYDKHLPHELVLRHLVHDPSLVTTFADLADHFVEKREREARLASWDGMYTTATRLGCNKELARRAESEDAVRQFYIASFAHHAARVASVLYFGSPLSSWRPTIAVVIDDVGTPRADLLLQWHGNNNDLELDTEAKEKADAAYNFNPCIITFEFKSLTVAQDMPNLLRLVTEYRDAEFNWIHCGSKHDPSTKTCRAHPPASVRGVRAAFDALGPAESIGSSIRATFGLLGDTLSHVSEPAPPPTKCRLSLRVRRRSAKSMENGRRIASVNEMLPDPSSEAPQAKKVAEPKGGLQNGYILQQVWAEAVHHDATYILISTSNTEYFCVRHRQTQTLYVSDYVDHTTQDGPPLGKLHVGFFIAAMDDSIGRATLAADRASKGHTTHIPDLGPVGARLDNLPPWTGEKGAQGEQSQEETGHDNRGGDEGGSVPSNDLVDGREACDTGDTETVSKRKAVSNGAVKGVRITSARKPPKKPSSSASSRARTTTAGGSRAGARLAEEQPAQIASQRRRTRSAR